MTKQRVAVIAVLAAAVAIGVFVAVKMYRVVPESPLPDAEAQFRYGVVDNAGAPQIPYWMWLTLPRVFPDLLPGPGGYPTLGISWDLGQELPIGFSKKTVGYPRVGTNCALCHAAVERGGDLENPKFVVVRRPAVSNLAAYLRFLSAAANDSRFNADAFLDRIDYAYKLSWSDKLLYRYWIIPSTRRTLREIRIPSGAVHPKDSAEWPQLEKWINDNATR